MHFIPAAAAAAAIAMAAFLATACAESSSNETGDETADSVARDTLAGEATSPAGDPAGDVATSIPARFHGEWNADLDACGTGASPTRLRISGDRIRFYESSGTVQAVEIASDRVVEVTAEYQGEGDTWQDERRLTLSPDGNSLTVSGGGDLVRYRCS